MSSHHNGVQPVLTSGTVLESSQPVAQPSWEYPSWDRRELSFHLAPVLGNRIEVQDWIALLAVEDILGISLALSQVLGH